MPSAILNDDKIMAVSTRKVTSNFFVNPPKVLPWYAFERLVPQGNALLLIEGFDNNAVDLFFDDSGFNAQCSRIHGYSCIHGADNHCDRKSHEDSSDPQREFAIGSMCQSHDLGLDRNFDCSRFAGKCIYDTGEHCFNLEILIDGVRASVVSGLKLPYHLRHRSFSGGCIASGCSPANGKMTTQ
jgi:hypothetical protein